MPTSVLAVLNENGIEFVDPVRPIVRADDLGVTRGDGVFETLGVFAGRAQALDAHLARLARSAGMLDLTVPPADVLRRAVVETLERFGPGPEAMLKIIVTRGVEGAGASTCWLQAADATDSTAARTDGVRVAVLSRGLAHDAATDAPWLLLGAKTLSYAVNRAALRAAAEQGADDALFISTDGYLLEGATANLLLLQGDRLVTPSTGLGILPGTTQSDAFGYARGREMTTAYALLTREDLDAADAAWLVSSVRLAVPIRAVDGVERAVDAAFTAALNSALAARTD